MQRKLRRPRARLCFTATRRHDEDTGAICCTCHTAGCRERTKDSSGSSQQGSREARPKKGRRPGSSSCHCRAAICRRAGRACSGQWHRSRRANGCRRRGSPAAECQPGRCHGSAGGWHTKQHSRDAMCIRGSSRARAAAKAAASTATNSADVVTPPEAATSVDAVPHRQGVLYTRLVVQGSTAPGVLSAAIVAGWCVNDCCHRL